MKLPKITTIPHFQKTDRAVSIGVKNVHKMIRLATMNNSS